MVRLTDTEVLNLSISMALGATNTFFKARLNNSRMCYCINNNEDIMHNLLISSDPLRSGLRRNEKKGKQKAHLCFFFINIYTYSYKTFKINISPLFLSLFNLASFYDLCKSEKKKI